MQINIVLIIVILLLSGGIIKGYQNGMVKELATLISLTGALAAGAAVIAALHNYQTKDTIKMVIAVICLVIVLLAYKIIDFILASLKMISRIPIMSGLNKLLGGAAGAGEAVIVIWIAFLLLTVFDIAGIRSILLNCIRDNKFLSFLFYNNYVSKWIMELGDLKEVFLEFF